MRSRWLVKRLRVAARREGELSKAARVASEQQEMAEAARARDGKRVAALHRMALTGGDGRKGDKGPRVRKVEAATLCGKNTERESAATFARYLAAQRGQHSVSTAPRDVASRAQGQELVASYSAAVVTRTGADGVVAVDNDGGYDHADRLFTREELRVAVAHLNPNAASLGVSLRALTEEMRDDEEAEQCLRAMNAMWVRGTRTDAMGVSRFTPQHKGGAVTAARFRYLGVNVDVARLYDQLLRGRLVEDTARTGVIPTTQLGFQARRGCIDALFIVNSARSRMLVHGQPLLTVFIDAEMAYPSVDHEVLLAQLLRCGVRGRMRCAVRAMLPRRCCSRHRCTSNSGRRSPRASA